MTLFDMDAAVPAEPEKPLSRDRRRTLRQKQALEHGQHPLGLLGAPLRLHPEAPPVADRHAPGPRCGSCLLLERNGWGYLKCIRGRPSGWGTPSGRRGPYETASGATDMRAWWPACEHWQQRSDGAS